MYMDSPGYMKHSYMTSNSRTKHQDKGKRRLACVLPVQRYANLLVALNSGLLNTLSFRLQPRTASINASNTLELHGIVNARPRNSRVHAGPVSCVKSYFASFGPKNLVLYSCFVLRFSTTKSVIDESAERPGSE